MKHQANEHLCRKCKRKFRTTTDSSVQVCEKCHEPTERDQELTKMVLGMKI